MSEKVFKVVAVPAGKPPFETEMTVGDIRNFVQSEVVMFHFYDDIFAFIDKDWQKKDDGVPNRTLLFQDKSPIPCTIINNFVLVRMTSNGNITDMSKDKIKEAVFVFRATKPESTIII